MTTANECYRYARESVAAAEKAKDKHDRKQFLDMARAWTRAALLLEGASPISIDATGTGPNPPELPH